MVKVYTIAECPWCEKVKKYLNSKGVAFKDIDVEEDMAGRKELLALTKDQSIPTTYYNGEFVVGFEKDKLDKLLGL